MQIKLFKFLLISLIVIGIILLTGCIEREIKNSAFLSTSTPTHTAKKDVSIPDNIEEYNKKQNDLWFSVGQRCKELSSIPSIDDPAILVNGLPITKRTIEFQKANLVINNKSLKEAIVSIVRLKVVNAEAIKLGIQPSQDDVDAELTQQMNLLKSEMSGSEGTRKETLNYINGMGITLDEYKEKLKKDLYDELQRVALRKTCPNGTDYDKYTDELVEKADIEILDPEMQELLKN